MAEKRIKVTKGGPYLVTGNIPLGKAAIGADEYGNSVKWVKGEDFPVKECYQLCRCGGSGCKPLCDGSHLEVDFDGEETASHAPFDKQAEVVSGFSLSLSDVEVLCAGARFCHNRKGRVWDLVRSSGDLGCRAEAIKQSCDCPSGRLVARDKKTGKVFEPDHGPRIDVVEDPPRKVSGPLWVKGRIQIESAEGKVYEVRNRVTLCRCGKSKNKPFCDGAHVSAGFSDGDESLQ